MTLVNSARFTFGIDVTGQGHSDVAYHYPEEKEQMPLGEKHLIQRVKMKSWKVKVCAVMMVQLVSGCSKAPQDMGCDDQDVQLNARKLLVMQLEEWQRPSSERLGADIARQVSPQLDATLNGLRARSVKPDQVRLTDVVQTSVPQSPLEAADPDQSQVPALLRSKPTGNKRLYGCKAVAAIELPQEIHAGLPGANAQALG